MKKYLVMLLLVVLSAFILSGAVSATEKISKNKDGTNSNSDSVINDESISADGRYVVFFSSSTDIVDNDANAGITDIFVRDTVTKKTQRVNYKKDGNQPTSSCQNPVISANGRYIAYSSNGNLGFNTPVNVNQIYLYDRNTQNTELVSKNTQQQPGTGDSYYPSISADGRYISFESSATNLWDARYEATGIDSNTVSDIFVRDRQNGVTKRINLSPLALQANAPSNYPSISADGRYVAFQSTATNLVDGVDAGADYDIFVRDLSAGTTKRIMGLLNTEPNGVNIMPSISGNGQYVSFYSTATNLVTNDNNIFPDVFVANMFTPLNPTVTLVSVSSSEVQGNQASLHPSISADGRYILFHSIANNLVSGDTNGQNDVFVRDRINGLTKRISVSSTGTQGNGPSFVGTLAAISANGKYAIFSSLASNLVSGDTNNLDVFINTVDFAGPTVKSIKPKNKSKKIKRSSNIYIYFNENIRLQNGAKIILKNSKGKIIKTTKTISGKLLKLNPTVKLSRYTKYYITLLQGAVSDFANNYNLNTKKYVYKFTTGRR